jgi:hypothetical protein
MAQIACSKEIMSKQTEVHHQDDLRLPISSDTSCYRINNNTVSVMHAPDTQTKHHVVMGAKDVDKGQGYSEYLMNREDRCLWIKV